MLETPMISVGVSVERRGLGVLVWRGGPDCQVQGLATSVAANGTGSG